MLILKRFQFGPNSFFKLGIRNESGPNLKRLKKRLVMLMLRS